MCFVYKRNYRPNKQIKYALSFEWFYKKEEQAIKDMNTSIEESDKLF